MIRCTKRMAGSARLVRALLAGLLAFSPMPGPAGAQEGGKGRLLRTFEGGHWINVLSVVFSPDGRTVLSGGTSQSKLWDVATGRLLRTFDEDSELVTSVAFSTDGQIALTGRTDNTIRVWDLASGLLLRTLKGHSDPVRSVAFSPDGRTALSGSLDRTLKVWNVASGRLLRTLKGHSDRVNAVAFSPDGGTAISGSQDKTLKLWDVASGRLLHTFEGHPKTVTSVAFSPDGHTVLSGSADALMLWDVGSGRLLRTFDRHAGSVLSVAFSPDGRTALSGNIDKTLGLWDVASGRLLNTFEGHAMWVNAVAFSPDGRTAISGSEDKTLKLWDLGLPEPAAVPQPVASNSGFATAPMPVAVTSGAVSERRVALVIGNSTYRAVPRLTNPASDARVVAQALRKIGFSAVIEASDLTREQFLATVQSFAAEADTADWAIVYFAGHGLEIGGVNYLIPVDAKLLTDRDVPFEALPLNTLLSALEGAKKLRLVVLDACRNNPFASQMKMASASRSVGRGLARIEPDAGTLVVYAARDGQIAQDGDGANSPFASALIRQITAPGVEIRRLFDLVADDVMELTKNAQQPYTYGRLSGRANYFFVHPR